MHMLILFCFVNAWFIFCMHFCWMKAFTRLTLHIFYK